MRHRYVFVRLSIGLLSLVFSSAALAQAAKDIAFLGQYSSIVFSPASGDCDGFGIRLWSITSKAAAPSVVGTWIEADGPCDKAVPIFAVRFNAKTGALTFLTMNASDPGAPGRFEGRLEDSALAGTFLWGGQPAGTAPVQIRLPRSQSGAGLVKHQAADEK
ncbi:MAG TPA: hypothetical protein VFG03_08760 [Telluria sp.]|nr:hypothetical protein [Telluria sp.]